MQQARKVRHGSKPCEQQWQAGRWADRLQAVQAFALDRAQPRELALAIESLQVCAVCALAM